MLFYISIYIYIYIYIKISYYILKNIIFFKTKCLISKKKNNIFLCFIIFQEVLMSYV